MMSLGALVFLFSAAVASASVIRSFPFPHAAVSHIHDDIPAQAGFVPFGVPNYLPPSLVQYIVNGNSKDCDHHGGIITPEAPVYAVPYHQPAAIALQETPYPSPAVVAVAIPELPRFIEEIKPEVITQAHPPAPEPCVHDVVLTPQVSQVYVPEAPVLPPFVQPELPVFIPVEQHSPVQAPVIIPEAPILPPFVQPELPTAFFEEPTPAEPCAPVLPPYVQPELPVIIEQPAPAYISAPAPAPVIIPEAPVLPPFVQPTVFYEEASSAAVIIPEAPQLPARPCLDTVVIPARPELPAFVAPEIPQIVVKHRIPEPVRPVPAPVFTASAYDVGYFLAQPPILQAPLQIAVENSLAPAGVAFAHDCIQEIVKERVIPHVQPAVHAFVPRARSAVISGPHAGVYGYPVHK